MKSVQVSAKLVTSLLLPGYDIYFHIYNIENIKSGWYISGFRYFNGGHG